MKKPAKITRGGNHLGVFEGLVTGVRPGLGTGPSCPTPRLAVRAWPDTVPELALRPNWWRTGLDGSTLLTPRPAQHRAMACPLHAPPRRGL